MISCSSGPLHQLLLPPPFVLEREREREMKNSGSINGSSKVDRKTVEKNRRLHMKTLCFKLDSLIPKEEKNSKDATSQHDHLDQAATYIKKLKARIEKLKQRKNRALSAADGVSSDKDSAGCVITTELGLPVIEVRWRDPILEVVLVTGLVRKFMFYQVIAALVEEGAEVVNAGFSVVNDKIFYTIHSQAISSRIGLDASRVSDRLKELIQ